MPRTVFLSASIHCSTCTTFIEDLLMRLHPPPLAVQVSILNHSVTVDHAADYNVPLILDQLANNGYDVAEVVADTSGSSSWTSSSTRGWLKRANSKSAEHRHERHMEHCKQCQDGLAHQTTPESSSSTPSESSSSKDEQKSPFVVVSSLDSPSIVRASLSINGMSCSSCVGSITRTLESMPWVSHVNVNLLTRSATVDFHQTHSIEEVLEAITDLGYEASLVELKEVNTRPAPGSALVKATFAIQGMTCNSCVSSITKALESQPWMHQVDVNLLTHSAALTFDDETHVKDIVTQIDELGYEAELHTMTKEDAQALASKQRKAILRVDGMHCPRCPQRIRQALTRWRDELTVDQGSGSEDSLFAVTYVPRAPRFTIRSIVAAIEAVDSAFVVSIYHPPTVEDRARQLLAQARRGLLYRILLSIVAAIPAFVIGIVYMNLVPTDNPWREYLMGTIHGVSRADCFLLAVATPVYLFAADIFHRRTVKELYSLWRPGSSVPLLRRFYRFGSMDMLVSFATSIAYFSSIAEMAIAAADPSRRQSENLLLLPRNSLGPLTQLNMATTKPHSVPYEARSMTQLDSVVFLTVFLLSGRLIEAYSKAKTGEAVSKLGSLRPQEALLVVDSDQSYRDDDHGADDDDDDSHKIHTKRVAIDLIDTGDTVRVVHGASPPWDGVLAEGQSDFVESSLTGESRPVKKALGDPIYAGTINNGSPITMNITGASGRSLLDQIISAVREGQTRRAPIERVADTITGYFVPLVTLIAIATWLVWLALGQSGRLPPDYLDVAVGGWPFWSLRFAIAVFVIACPCGIGLAAPTALFVGSGLAAQHGILAKGGGQAFQEASNLDIVVFDKTGTLTEGGEPQISDHLFLPGHERWRQPVLLGALGELESNSSHPIAKAIVTFCRRQGQQSVKMDAVEEMPGHGIKGRAVWGASEQPIDIMVGSDRLMKDKNIKLDPNTLHTAEAWQSQAKSVVFVAARASDSDGESSWTCLALFAVSDRLRSEARSVLEALRKRDMDVWMISGDNERTAHAVGAALAIPQQNIIAGVLPDQKADEIRKLHRTQTVVETTIYGQSRSRRPVIAMVGDGVNDSPALTVADVGVAIGSGSDVAVSAADFVLVNPSLTSLLTLTRLSKAVFSRVKFNFAWAFIYNMIALPVAAGAAYPLKINGSHTRLDPAWAALAMALSSLSVIVSSLLLRYRVPLAGFTLDKRLQVQAK